METLHNLCFSLVPQLTKRYSKLVTKNRDGSRTPATCKMERFMTIVNGLKPLTIFTKSSILDVAGALHPPLKTLEKRVNLA